MTQLSFGHHSTLPELQGMTIIDLHSHSTLSDGKDSALDCLRKAHKRNINLCLTDHNEIRGSLLACEKGFSLPSIEVTSKDCYDFLFYFSKPRDLTEFYTSYIRGHRLVEKTFLNYYRLRWSTEDLLQKAKNSNAVIVLAHPDAIPPKNSGVFIDGNKDLLNHIDAIEAINSTMSEASNKKAIHYARSWKKPMTGASDAHLARFIGAGVTAFESTTVDDILEDIRKGRNIVVGNNLKFLYKLQTTITVLKNNLRW